MLHQLTSTQHSKVKHLVKLRQNRDYRYEHHSLVIEGIKMIGEMSVDTHFKCVVVLDESLLPLGVKADEIFIVSENVMHKISAMHTPEGIVAEIPMPSPAPLTNKKYLIALDGIADPGNLGTLLRTALALGWEGAFILENSCDPFNEKAIRAARGATFRLPLAWGSWPDLIALIKNNGLIPVVADLHGHPLADMQTDSGTMLVLGNEAQGVSAEAKAACQAVTIPMPGAMESLNVAVAGGIMMYELRKKNNGSKRT